METPKEKAKELVNKFQYMTVKNNPVYLTKTFCKQCALICVDEIIDVLESYGGLCDVLDDYEYWQQVKQEIEKL